MKSAFALSAVCVCAFAGGLVGSWLFTPGENRNATFETLTVTKDLIVAADVQEGTGCRLRADGTVTASQGVLAKQVRSQVIAAQSVLASLNPTTASFDDQQILAQMTADPSSGGKLVAVNREGALVPSAGASKGGSAACIRFHPTNGKPEIFTHDLSRGEAGKAFMVAVQQPPAAQPAEATAAEAGNATRR